MKKRLVLGLTVVIAAASFITISVFFTSKETLYFLPFDFIKFEEISKKGASHEIDTGEKTTYDAVKDHTEPIYRQLSSLPNLLYIKAPNKNTLFTEDMGMSAYEVDPLGNVVWQRRVQGETYYGIEPINSDEILLSVLNKSLLLKINKKTGVETIIANDDFRDIHLTPENKIAVVQNKEEGKIILFDLNGEKLWESQDTFFWARGVWQKKDMNFLIADFRNKIYEVDYQTGKIIWDFDDDFYYPNSIQEMLNGNYLVADEHNNRIVEVNPQKNKVVKEFSEDVFSPNCAKELENGNWLICDTDNHRIIEVKNQKVVWELSNLHAPNKVSR